MNANSHPLVVSTAWVHDHLDDPNVRIVESNEDALLFHSGHLRSAEEIDWVRDLNHPLIRDYLDGEAFSELCSRKGITRDSHVVFYGDKSNWWACYAFWVFSLFQHPRLSVMDGGRLAWELENRPLTKERSKRERSSYPVVPRDDKSERAFRNEVESHLHRSLPLVDVRSPQEFSGERLHMSDYPNEGALRGGHIPGAKNIPWSRAVNPEDGRFLPTAALRKIYCEENALSPDQDLIAYCRIGERSSHTWFVLKHLLGFSRVRNYDGSWTEWGNLVGAPIER